MAEPVGKKPATGDFSISVKRYEFEPKVIPGVVYTDGRGVHLPDEPEPANKLRSPPGWP